MTRFATRAALAAALLLAAAMGAAAQDNYETTEIAEGVYQFRWIAHNAMFVTTDDGVVVFDTIGVDAARQLAAEIQRTAPGSPLIAIVYSHSDADHATGAGALMEAMGQTGVPIIAHELAVAPIEARGSADQPAPTVTFADTLRFQLGGRWIELHYLGPSHTDNIAVPFIPDAGVAFAVDFASNDRAGFRDPRDLVLPRVLRRAGGPARHPVRDHRLRPRAGGGPGLDPAADRLLRRPDVGGPGRRRSRVERGRGGRERPSRRVLGVGQLRAVVPAQRARRVPLAGRRRRALSRRGPAPPAQPTVVGPSRAGNPFHPDSG